MVSTIKNNIQENINQLSDDEARWFAVYTKFKCEKFVTDQLAKKNIEAYIPIVTKTRRYHRKIKHFEIPLINCYVFVNIKKVDYLRTLETDYVMKFLRQGKDLLAIPDREIETLKRVAGDVVETISQVDYSFQFGEEVEVISGHLTGMSGKIISRAGKKCFVVELETIGCQLRIKIDLNMLKPIKNINLIA